MPLSTPADLAAPLPAEAAPPPPSAGTALLIDIPRTAELLGLSAKTVSRMATAGELPGVVKIRRRRLVSLEALRAWIAEGCPPLPTSAAGPRRRRSR
jgi:excisionase family DNA binding protein